MSTQPVTSGTTVQNMAIQLAQQLDTNKDGQISVSEFANFLEGFLRQAMTNQTAGIGTAAGAVSSGSGAYSGAMLGFDLSRLQSAKDSPKYAFANLAMNLAPTDANMQAIAQQLGPSVGHLDSQDNFMLDGDAGGYIGVRDRGNGPEWQWMAYNTAHPGPNGEIT